MVTPDQFQSTETIREQVLQEQVSHRPSFLQYIAFYLGHKPLGTVGFSIVVLMIF